MGGELTRRHAPVTAAFVGSRLGAERAKAVWRRPFRRGVLHRFAENTRRPEHGGEPTGSEPREPPEVVRMRPGGAAAADRRSDAAAVSQRRRCPLERRPYKPMEADAMKPKLFLLNMLAVGGVIGCGTSAESDAPADGGNKVARHENQGANVHRGHRHHHGGFGTPERFEEEWNGPDRDGWQHPEEIVAALALAPGATVADIGAGTGYMVAHLSKAVGEGGTVIAIDAEQGMVTYLKARSEALGPARIMPRKVGVESPDLQDDSVDGVVTLNTWHHIGGREAYAKKVYSGLRRGGRFVVVDCEVDAESGPPREMRVEPGQVVKELEAGGFRAELAHESMPKHYMVVGHKD